MLTAAPKILPEIPSRLGEYAAQELESRGFELHVATTLASVSAREAVLGDGTRIPTRTLVWTAGVRPHPLLNRFGRVFGFISGAVLQEVSVRIAVRIFDELKNGLHRPLA